MSTHSLGLKCSVCEGVLIEDNCCEGQRHGYTFQEADGWAAENWPDHPCFSWGCSDDCPEDCTADHRGEE